MTPEVVPRRDTPALKSWGRIQERLGAVIRLTSGLGYQYPSLDFATPAVLTRPTILNRQMIRWSGPERTELWLRAHDHVWTIGIRLDSTQSAPGLVYWAIIDPADPSSSTSGFVVTRSYRGQCVAKVTRHTDVRLNSRAVCVIAPAQLNCKGDGHLLSALAIGFSDAAADQDRDVWSSWLWNQVAVGRLRARYVSELGSKVLRRPARAAQPRRITNSSDVLTALANVGVFERDADYVLPSGLHAAVHINLGRACGFVDLLRLLAEQINQKLADVDYNTIVSTGWPTAAIARRLIRLRPMTSRGIVRHCEYEGVPSVPLTAVSKGSDVVVLTDVIVTGGLIAQVKRSIESAGAQVKAITTVVHAGPQNIAGDGTVRSLCHYDVQATSAEQCPRCHALERREFNPIACCMTRKKKSPRSPGEFLEQNPEAAEFWKHVDVAKAYEHHRVEGNTHYLAFIDTARLLTHATIGPSIVTRLLARLPSVIGNAEVILAPDRTRARLLADKLLQGIAAGDRLFPPDIVLARQVDGRFRVSIGDGHTIRNAKVLIVDTGVTHGATLDELQELAVQAGAATVGAMALISRMSDIQESALAGRFSGRFARLYQVPIRPLSIHDSLRGLCPICRRRDFLVRSANESRLQPIVELSAAIVARHRRRKAHMSPTPVTRAMQLKLMAQDDAPFLSTCRRGTASGVTLHSLHAAMNDGMAPLTLPEIHDDRIPAASRTSILEHLEEGALEWSGDWLLKDVERFVSARDLDETWGACASLLNRAGRSSWIDALEHRLISSETARHQESAFVWNRIAFEMFSMVQDDPVHQQGLSMRLAALQEACAKTPAADGLARVRDVVDKVAHSNT